jgi:hypothetical protein
VEFLQLYSSREPVGDIPVCNVRPEKRGRRKERMMGQQLQPWRSGNGQNLWLSMLIDAMEKVARPEFRATPCDQLVLAAVSAQLARPASPYLHCKSHFSLRN